MAVWSARSRHHASEASVVFRPPLGVYFCTTCRHMQESDTDCVHCGASATQLSPLARGLVSLDTASDWGIVHYDGERVIEALAVGLVLLLPTAAVLGLATDFPTSLLGVFFLGLPILAFVDAHRAGAAGATVEFTVPEVAPTGAYPHTGVPGPDPVRIRGVARQIDDDLAAPVSDHRGLAVRFDVRAGPDAEIVARYLDGVEFLVVADDGTSVLVTGAVDLQAAAYGEIAGARDTSFQLCGVSLLPASFTDGGWACELLVRDGDRIEVTGHATGEIRPNPHGLYRDAGAIQVMHGEPGHPVSIRVV